MTPADATRDSTIAIADAHSDLVVDVLRRRDAGETAVLSHHHADALAAAGVRMLMMSTGGDGPTQNLGSDDPFWCTMVRIRALLADLEDSADRFAMCRSMDEVDAAMAGDRIAVMMMIEGATPLKTSIDALDIMQRWGIRSIQLTWNARNMVGDGCAESLTGGGLTRFGRTVVQEMNARAMLVDLSHASEALFYSVAETAMAPFIVSHANARTLCEHRRNLTDDQLRVLAEQGGVAGLCAFPGFIDPERPTVERLTDHCEHIAATVGIDHVAIGADFIYFAPELFAQELARTDRAGMYVKGLNPPAELKDLRAFALLEQSMLKRGFKTEEIAKVFSENLLRVYRKVIG